MENETPKLKRCPFCGSEDCLITDISQSIFVTCFSCAAEGPCHSTSADALRAWNKRPADTMKAQMAEALDCCREWLHDEHGECDGSCRQDEDGKACVQCLVIEALADYREGQAS